LGWIEFGKTIKPINGIQVKEFISWHYRPDLETAKKYYKSQNHAWNPGYFVVMPEFVLKQFQKHAPAMYTQLEKINLSYGHPDHRQILNEVYPRMEKISFDDAIVTKTDPDKAVVLSVDLGWSDIGAWESLKEALQSYPNENVTKGYVFLHRTSDSIVYNYTDQLVTTVEVDGVVVIVTKDAILVTKQQSIPEIKNMLKRFEDTDLEKFT
jgi:mannose-1-phosphate guanylyltransferase